MKKRLYPAVLERGPRDTFGAWFPDFPGCVAGGRSQEETIEQGREHAGAGGRRAVRAGQVAARADADRADRRCRRAATCVAYFIVGVDPPDPSERVNVYLPKSLIARIDRRAAELGMSRSSFFGLAASMVLSNPPGASWLEPAPRSKVHKTGALRQGKPAARKP